MNKRERIDNLINSLENIKINPKKEVNDYLINNHFSPINEKITALEFLRRPDVTFLELEQITQTIEEEFDIKDQALIEIKYSGYIQKAYKEAEKLKKLETRKIPSDMDYNKVLNLALEAKEKLEKVRPSTIAQAARISGVNPSDITMLLVYLESSNGKNNK